MKTPAGLGNLPVVESNPLTTQNVEPQDEIRLSSTITAYGHACRSVAKVALTFALISGIVGANPTSAGEIHQLHSGTIVDKLPNHALPSGDGTCPKIDTQYILTATTLLKQPPNPDIDKRISLNPSGMLQRQHEEFQVEQDVAGKYGLTLHDPSKFEEAHYKEFSEPDSPNKTIPYIHTFNQAKAYLKEFNVDLEIGDPHQSYDDESHGPTTNDLNKFDSRNSLFNLIQGFSRMPQEYVVLSGLKKITLVAHSRDDDAWVYMSGTHDSMYLDISNHLTAERDYYHEMGHLVDAATCGSGEATDNDPQFASNNVGDEYNASSKKISHDAYVSTVQDSINTLQSSSENQRLQVICEQIKHAESFKKTGAKISLATDYAGTNIREDKAEVYRYLPNADNFDDLYADKQTYHVGNKFVLLFSRLLYYRPAVAAFFNDTALKGSPPLDTAISNYKCDLKSTK